MIGSLKSVSGAGAGDAYRTLGTVPAGKAWLLLGVNAANKTASSQNIDLAYTDASNAGAEVSLARSISLATATSVGLLTGKTVLEAGDALKYKVAGNTFGVKSSASIVGSSMASDGAGTIVSSSSSGKFYLTTDYAETVTQIDSGFGGNNTGMAFGAGLFVAHNGSNFLSSPTGVTWTQRTAAAVTINRIIHNGTVFVAVGNVGVIYTSPDGITWTSRTSGVSVALNDVAYGGGKLLAIGAPAPTNAASVTSTDNGATWTANNSGIAVTLASVAWWGAQSVFLTHISGSSGYITTDGITYTPSSSVPNSTIYQIVAAGSDVYCLSNAKSLYIPTSLAENTSKTMSYVLAHQASPKLWVYTGGKLCLAVSGGLLIVDPTKFTSADSVACDLSASYMEVPA